MFRGNVVRPSHEGGLLISFTGSSPALGSSIETENGIRLGKVDTVLGSIHEPWVHVYPITKGLDIVDVLGENAIITNKKSFQNSKSRRDDRRSNFSRNGGKNTKKIYNDNDWICPTCKNVNFSWRERCNKCSTRRDSNIRVERNKKWGDGNRSERSRRGREDSRSERPKWGRRDNRSERPRRGREDSRSERPKWGRRDNRSERSRRGREDRRSERPRRDNSKFDNNKKSNPKEAKFRSPKRLRGKSRTHFKNRELDDIFKNRDR